MGSDGGLLAPVWAGTRAEEITSDAAWLRAMLEAEAALARAQARLELIPSEAAAAIDRTAAALVLDPADLARRARQSANPVVPLVADLRRAVPGAASSVHRGATSQDILDSAAMLVATRAIRGIVGDLSATMRDLGELAGRHRDTVMAARTLGQQAVPTTFGLKAAGWLAGLMRARARLRELRLPAQLGGAAGTLAAFAELAGAPVPASGASSPPSGTRGVDPGTALLLAEVFAEEIGLAAPLMPWHAERSPVTELGAALTATARALGKPATDIVLMAQTEVGEVAESSAGSSSAMPQKRNPALSVLVRSAAFQVPAYAQVLGQIGEHERAAGAWQAEWLPLREALRLTGGAAETAAELVAGLRVFPDRMRANAELTGGRLVAERLAAHLDREALEAALSAGGPLEGRADLLDPAAYLGAAPELVDRILATYREQP
ncbi:lyase family protein [Nonomuraea angiospora]|uniref:3-carboxy-cis,cis-muconate cycloisomerase n=1 Tax=Nonomuraea angiospora TaxID=46172 RepID=A0ABR9LXS5_9ACTN|nr:lyase family protein [Nonomuraea angiospora]MBE1585449.1 3-carboxy-cis,cis-muconate cycloisomerase [Nonomuraea angiospora]